MRLLDVVRELRIPVAPEGHEHRRLGWLNIDCHLCSRGWKHFRLGLNEHYVYGSCWHCGRVNIVEALSVLSGESKANVHKLLEELRSGARLSPHPSRSRERGRLVLPRNVGCLTSAHIRYLESRNLDPDEVMKFWEVQGLGLEAESHLRWRLFIPVFLHGEMVSWTTRSIGDTHAVRYRSASPEQESVDHKSILYGADHARHSIIVCEGPIDAWTIGPGTVATMGTAYSRTQVLEMVRYPLRVICFDNERTAQIRAKILCDMLSVFPGQTFNVRLDGKDPNSSSRREIKELRKRFLL